VVLWAWSQRVEAGWRGALIAGNGCAAGRRWVRVGVSGAVACAVLLGVASAARASFPGVPGEIVFSSTFSGDREIYVAGADGSGRVDLTRAPQASDITPSWSADGRQIAFASDRSGSMEIYKMNADGSAVVQLTRDGAYADDPRFTADGRFVVYESKTGGNWEIRRVGVDGSGEVDLTRSRASDRSPTTSPNGRLVAFSSNRGSTGTHIWVMSIQGTALRRVTTGKGSQREPAWAPTGGRLAYVAGSLEAGTTIWTVLANGKRPRPLTAQHDKAELNPSWSPDARSIVYQECSPGNLIACTLSVKALGGNPVDISQLRAPFLETFDSRNGNLWQSFQNGSGATNSEANGKLTTTLAADSLQGGQYNEIEAHWGTNCELLGDFDVQVDYELLEWPAANGVQAGLDSFDATNPIFAIRESQAFGEQYSSWIPQSFNSLPTSDLAGTLRVQREGSTAVVSYLTGATWVSIASGPTTTSPASITLGANSGMDRFAHEEVKIAWDNLRINSGSISCPTTWWEDDSPDWQAVG
jgi:Tol biopolymer transport system component